MLGHIIAYVIKYLFSLNLFLTIFMTPENDTLAAALLSDRII